MKNISGGGWSEQQYLRFTGAEVWVASDLGIVRWAIWAMHGGLHGKRGGATYTSHYQPTRAPPLI